MKLSYAVGTTYSLDLEALLSAAVSFGVMESPDEEMMKNPIVVLEAIRRFSDKLTLFCNIDGIKPPKKPDNVYSLLENSIVPVYLGKGINFHPKMWVIRYEDDKEEIIRVIILSRNLTFDRSMDVAVEMTGRIDRNKKRIQKKHQPIADLLYYLSEKMSDDNRDRVVQLAQDILLVNRFDIDDQYEDYKFLPTGFPGYEGKARDMFGDATSVLMVSPFLTKSVLEEMTKNANKSILISRISSVTEEIYRMFDEIYVPKDGLEDDNALEEGEADNAPRRDLHAKVIYKECAKGNYLYLGSLNATANAFYHNIELMLELKFRPYMASLKQVKADFVEDKYGAFQQMLNEPESVEAEDGEEMADFSDVVEAIRAAVVLNNGENFCTEIHTEDYHGNAEIKPLFGSGEYKKMTDIILFERMTLKELSELYAVQKKDQTCVLKIDTSGIPIEDRDNAVFNSIIDTKPEFLRYILFLLAEDPAMAVVENNDFLRLIRRHDAKRNQGLSPAIYEKLLLTAAREPDRLNAVKAVLDRVDMNIIDVKAFENMLNIFMKAVEGK